jgi:protein Cut8
MRDCVYCSEEMDGRSPLAFLSQNNPFSNTFPRLKPSPRSSPSPSSANRRPSSPANTLQQQQKPSSSSALSVVSSPSVKRKASFAEEDHDDQQTEGVGEDIAMSTSPLPSPRTLKRPRHASISKRPLPVSRILDNLDKPALTALVSNLLSRHPDLISDFQSLAPKLTPQTAFATISRLESAFQSSFPYGGDKSGEYAYSRVHAAYTALLSAISDYTMHFLPPTNISPPELLSFLDNVTNVLHRIHIFHNPIHNIARESAFVNITNAWTLGIRYFLEVHGPFSFVAGGWLQRLEAHAEKEAMLRRVTEMVTSEVAWARGH